MNDTIDFLNEVLEVTPLTEEEMEAMMLEELEYGMREYREVVLEQGLNYLGWR